MKLQSADDLTEDKFKSLKGKFDKYKLTFPEAVTADNYDDEAQEYSQLHEDRYFIWHERSTFMKYLDKGKILDVGSGAGWDAEDFTDWYEYVGIDVSSKLVKQAKLNVPHAKFYQQSIYDLQFADNTFDGFWMCRVLHHIPKKRVNEALSSIRRVVKPNGIGMIATVRGKGEQFYITPDRQRYYAYYTNDELQKVLEDNDFEIIKQRVRLVSRKEGLLIFFVRVKKRAVEN